MTWEEAHIYTALFERQADTLSRIAETLDKIAETLSQLQFSQQRFERTFSHVPRSSLARYASPSERHSGMVDVPREAPGAL